MIRLTGTWRCCKEFVVMAYSSFIRLILKLLLQIQFMLLFSRQGKLRLSKWFAAQHERQKKKVSREIIATVLSRKPKMCSFLEWKDLKIVYKRYASLYFCCAVEQGDNELVVLEIIHRYVELLDKYFGSVSLFLYFNVVNINNIILCPAPASCLLLWSCILMYCRCVS